MKERRSVYPVARGIGSITGMVILFALFVPVAFAQQSFEEWQSQQNQAFESFVAQEDAEFAAFLEREWKQFQAFLESGFYEEPKLEDPPRIDAATRGGPTRRPPLERERPVDRERVEADPIQRDVVTISFYGIEIPLTVDDAIQDVRLSDVSPEGFSQYWEAAASSGGDDLAETVATAARERSLNDFTRFRLVVLLAEHLFDRPRDRAAATWYVMVKNGFDVRIAYSGDTIAVLLPSENTLYNTAYFSIDGRTYYLLDASGEPFRRSMQWQTYDAAFPGSDATVALELPETVGVPESMRTERLEFSYRGTDYTIEVPINEYIVEYLAEYPFTDWWVHFFPPTSTITRRTLVEELGRLVAGKTPAEAANMLLRFVQTAFPYETDQEHFGVEKWQAPEEILYYRISDCDDRSILYAFLLREVLGWDDVAMLLYPGHLAVAVPQRRLGVSGDSVRVNGETYIVTDPTYIGADIGMAMPQFRNVRPEANIVRRR